MKTKTALKTLLLVGAIATIVATGCKKDPFKNEDGTALFKEKSYDQLPENEKISAFRQREFKVLTVIKNGQDVTYSKKCQSDNNFFISSSFPTTAAYDYGEECQPVIFPPKNLPTKYAQPMSLVKKPDGFQYLTLTNYLLDSGQSGPIEFRITNFDTAAGKLFLTSAENGVIVDRVFSISKKLDTTPTIYDYYINVKGN